MKYFFIIKMKLYVILNVVYSYEFFKWVFIAGLLFTCVYNYKFFNQLFLYLVIKFFVVFGGNSTKNTIRVLMWSEKYLSLKGDKNEE